MHFLCREQHKIKLYQNKLNQSDPIRSDPFQYCFFCLLHFFRNWQKREKHTKAKWHHILSLHILMRLTNHTHTHLRRKSSPLRKGSWEKNRTCIFLCHIESVCVCVYVTFPNWPLWCHIHSKSICFFFTFFFVVNVMLSHFSYCSTHFQVILTMVIVRAYIWLTTTDGLVSLWYCIHLDPFCYFKHPNAVRSTLNAS